MKPTKVFLVIALASIFIGCSQASNDKMESQVYSDSTSNEYISSSAANENNKDSTRKFIRSADLKFKVKSVINSTYDIENITNQQGGFVTFTKLASNVDNVETTAVSADSSLETTYYTVSNEIIIRVPNTKLDTTLKLIANNSDFLDHRIIKADDVGLQILSNDLTQKRSGKNEERLKNAIDKKGNKLGETTYAEDVLGNKQEQSDNAKVSNLSLKDQIDFSTINLSIYQRATIKRELISNDKNIDAYEPSLGSKLKEALKTGWEILEGFLVSLTKLWGLFLFGLIVFIIYKRYRNKRIK
ncbi:MAG: DUF4349 domain-containing protein [Ginsengibacter sp.]|jgi:hypothetical protein